MIIDWIVPEEDITAYENNPYKALISNPRYSVISSNDGGNPQNLSVFERTKISISKSKYKYKKITLIPSTNRLVPIGYTTYKYSFTNLAQVWYPTTIFNNF